ncbi:MAG: alkaline phosphatase D family protein [Actinomycetota bacterium]|nr:alkaline phosphatase D family protein [Actinomycetota bacterium]
MRFRHGVASGDPLPDGVLIWTRVSGTGPEPVPVDWRVARHPALDDVVASGRVDARAEHDFTVKVDVTGLEPATTYHYGFQADGERSPAGRTRTAPAGPTATLRLGLTSCASYTAGFFNAYRNLARRHLDLVVHVGDYLYENSGVVDGRTVRAHDPAGIVSTLAGYRGRHAQYRSDPDLQALHQRHPMVAAWDDHEIATDAWRGGAGVHRRPPEGWAQRRADALQAYQEWMPVRMPDPSDPERIHRTIRLGDLADLVMLDTRLAGRDRPALGGSRAVPVILDRRRSLLGPAQREWLRHELGSSDARWKLIGNQVMMAPLAAVRAGGLGLGVNPGQWDGYPAERADLFRFLETHGLQVVVLTGDLHSSWACELPSGAEFLTPSVTSPSFADTTLPAVPGLRRLARRLLRWQNRHVRMADLEHHGYVVVDLTPERVQADWWHVDTATERSDGERFAGGWQLRHGVPGLVAVPTPVSG